MPPRIAIDARKLGDFGIGTYLETLLAGLARLDGDERYVVLVAPGAELPVASPRFERVVARARKYGALEHVTLPWLARRHGARLYHAPHYVLPWLTGRPSVVTIHDVIHL